MRWGRAVDELIDLLTRFERARRPRLPRTPRINIDRPGEGVLAFRDPKGRGRDIYGQFADDPASKKPRAVPQRVLKEAVKAARTSGGPARPVPVRQLLAAPRARQEAVMRDVYEGQFGNLVTKVTGVVPARDGLVVQGTIHTRRGLQVGRFQRSLYMDRGDVWANHAALFLDDTVQGGGFAAEFNQRAIDWYRQSGVDAVTLSASDIGQYAWAAAGFDFDGDEYANAALKNLHDLITVIRAGDTQFQFDDEFYDIPDEILNAPNLDRQLAAAEALLGRAEFSRWGEPGFPTAYELSQLGRRRGQRGPDAMWLGKFLMLHTPWDGIMWLTGGTRGADGGPARPAPRTAAT